MFEGKNYQLIRGSDIQRDGMFLELWTTNGERRGDQLLEIFFSDVTGRMTLNTFEADVPIELVEECLKQARESLPPLPDAELEG